jgi:hypothetical protein
MTENSTHQRSLYMTRRIGSTTYRVKVAFADNASETMEEKILRMIRNEGSATGPECGTMDVPQMGRPA